MTRRRRDAITAVLAALPALLLAAAGWVKADAAKRSENETYQGAAETIGEQAEEIYYLRKRLDVLERRVLILRGTPGSPLFQNNKVSVPGGTGIHVGDRYEDRRP